MSTAPSSLEAAAREQLGEKSNGTGITGAENTPEQIDAFRDDRGDLPSNVFQLLRQQDGEAQRGPGRPKGARNKRSQELAKLIAHKYGDPVEYMASLYAMPLDQVIELLKLADKGKTGKQGDLAMKAVNLQLSAAKAVSEYVHSRKPVEAVIRHEADAVLVMPGVGGGFEAKDEYTRRAAAIIGGALKDGRITAEALLDMRLADDGTLVDAEFTEVEE